MNETTYALGDRIVHRIGYGAMQLAGPAAMGPPKDRDQALAVLRALPELGIDHLDTADFYGPHVTNELIREALHPYDGLTIVTKVGYGRDETGDWVPEQSPDQLRRQVHDNLRRLGVETLDVVNFRRGGPHGAPAGPGSLAEQFGALAELRQQGKIRHLGLSTVDAEQVAEAQTIAPVVTVQNLYNIALRTDDALIDGLAAQGISFVPFFPLGGFSPLQSQTLDRVAARLGARPSAVALAWLLQRSPNILLIPGTSQPAHLRENVAAGALELDQDTVAELDRIVQR
jgi:pyridoxine 4-dehydrogenase